MTLEELLGCPEKWESLSDKQIIDYFDSFGVFNITRPDRESAVYKESDSTKKKEKKENKDDKMQLTFRSLDKEKKDKLFELAKAQGVDLSSVFKK